MLTRKDCPMRWLAIATKVPALTRLEPESVSGDPVDGALAAIAEPLWRSGASGNWASCSARTWDPPSRYGRASCAPIRRGRQPAGWMGLFSVASPTWRP